MSRNAAHARRRARVYRWLEENRVDAGFVTKDSHVRYLTGMPSDSVLLLYRTGSCTLLPWDVILAEKLADADEIVPYTEFKRSLTAAVSGMAERHGLDDGARIDAPPTTAVPVHAALTRALPGRELLCRDGGMEACIARLRMTKDAEEIALLESAAALTDRIVATLETELQSGRAFTELDVALFLERECRAAGAEGTGFTPIVAGPARSFGIHAFPAFTAGEFGGRGMSILDFGVSMSGYTSDITTTVVRGAPTALQGRMIALVEEAYRRASGMARSGVKTADIARAVDELFDAEGFSMPHGLGHGVGLDVHEAPWVRAREEDSVALAPGMVFTLEPGLYRAEAGGVRVENDFLITADGCRTLTTSRILRCP